MLCSYSLYEGTCGHISNIDEWCVGWQAGGVGGGDAGGGDGDAGGGGGEEVGRCVVGWLGLRGGNFLSAWVAYWYYG